MKHRDANDETRGSSPGVPEVHAHLLACWDRRYINADTHKVATWCGWGFDEAVAAMLRLRDAGLVNGEQHSSVKHYSSGPLIGKPLWFWMRPEGAHGLPFIDDPRLLELGIIRAVTDVERRVVTYQGARPLDVYRSAKQAGESISGWRLDWLGPDPTGRPQLELPLGVEFDQ